MRISFYLRIVVQGASIGLLMLTASYLIAGLLCKC